MNLNKKQYRKLLNVIVCTLVISTNGIECQYYEVSRKNFIAAFIEKLINQRFSTFSTKFMLSNTTFISL